MINFAVLKVIIFTVLLLLSSLIFVESTFQIQNLEPLESFSLQTNVDTHNAILSSGSDHPILSEFETELSFLNAKKTHPVTQSFPNVLKVGSPAELDSPILAPYGQFAKLSFHGFGEYFEFTLALDTSVFDTGSVIHSEDGYYKPQHITYKTATTDENGAPLHATFTILSSGGVEGLIVKDGETMHVGPAAFIVEDMERHIDEQRKMLKAYKLAHSSTASSGSDSGSGGDDATEDDEVQSYSAKLNRRIEQARLTLTKFQDVAAKASKGMSMYKLSEMKVMDEDGQPLQQCGEVHPDPQPLATTTTTATALSADDVVDRLLTNSPLASAVRERRHAAIHTHALDPRMFVYSSAPASTTATPSDSDNNGEPSSHDRKLLLKKWVDCFPKPTQRMTIGFLVDVGAAQTLSGSSPTVAGVSERVGALVALVNTVFQAQLDLVLTIRHLEIRTATSSEDWNSLGRDVSGSTCVSRDDTGYSALLNMVKAFKSSMSTQVATLHLLTNCFPVPGVVGLASIGSLCLSKTSAGWDSVSTTTYLTLAHELGHNLNAQHTFQNGQGKTGGIMDYGDSKLLSSDPDNPGEIGFNTALSKTEMCGYITKAVSGSQSQYSGDTRLTTSNCFYDYTGAVCGNGVVEEGEECDSSSPCCVNCKLASQATCATPGTCCVNCVAQPTTVKCAAGAKGNGYCGPGGVCVSSQCDAYSNTGYCNGPSPCVEKCTFNGGTSCQTVTGTAGQALTGSPCNTVTNGVCNSGSCIAQTFTWTLGPWGSCDCTAGTQTRTAQCNNQFGSTVGASYCETEQASTQSCSCSAAWKCYGPTDNASSASVCSDNQYGQCSNQCGAGTQSRNVGCFDTSGKRLDDSQCTNTGSKPDSSRSCTGSSGCSGSWRCSATALTTPTTTTTVSCDGDGGYSECSNQCGSGTQSRNTYCFSASGASVDVSNCATLPTPAKSKTCSGSAGCMYAWKCFSNTQQSSSASACVADQFSQCSTQCGSGSQTRSVACFDQSGAVVADSSCASVGSKPPASQSCSNTAGCTFAWSPSAWSSCVTQCGAGYQSRAVSCVQYGTDPAQSTTVSDSQCASTAKPALAQSCVSVTACSVDEKASQCNRVKPPSSVDQSLTTGQCECINGYSGTKCATPPGISSVSVSPSALISNQSAVVRWVYSGSDANNVTLMLDDVQLPLSTRLAYVKAKTQQVSVLVPPMRPSTQATLTVMVNTLFSASVKVSVVSNCANLKCGVHGVCDEDTSMCVCKDGFSGLNCATSPCARAQCVSANTNTCSDTDGVCQCKSGFFGAKCEQSQTCAQNCANAGYIAFKNSQCDNTCTCTNSWMSIGMSTASSVKGCTKCGLFCNTGDTDADCNKCVCNPSTGYSGSACACRTVFGKLSFAQQPSTDLTAWLKELLKSVIFDTHLPVDRVFIQDHFKSAGKWHVIVGISAKDCVGSSSVMAPLIVTTTTTATPAKRWGITSTATSVDTNANTNTHNTVSPRRMSRRLSASVLAETDVSDIYAAWDELTVSFDSPYSPAAALLQSSGYVSASALYDANCTGPDCPAGGDFFSEKTDDDKDYTTIIIVVCTVVGFAVLCVVGLGLLCCYRSQSGCWKNQSSSSGETDAQDGITANPAADIAMVSLENTTTTSHYSSTTDSTYGSTNRSFAPIVLTQNNNSDSNNNNNAPPVPERHHH